jgi:hypothetical protein
MRNAMNLTPEVFEAHAPPPAAVNFLKFSAGAAARCSSASVFAGAPICVRSGLEASG